MPAQNSTSTSTPLARAEAFCRRFGLRVPILQAPMAGSCPVGLAAAVANAGGMGGLGALTMAPNGIAAWAEQFRGQSNGAFQINLWVPDPPPRRDSEHERLVREFLGRWGPPVRPEPVASSLPRPISEVAIPGLLGVGANSRSLNDAALAAAALLEAAALAILALGRAQASLSARLSAGSRLPLVTTLQSF